MVELFKSERVAFPRGKQKEFLLAAKKALNLSGEKIAKLLRVSNRTLTDWQREKFLISLNAVKIILEKTKNKMPKNVRIKNPFWYTRKGAKAGGLAVYKKYGRIGGNPKYRKKKWCEWWEKEGKYKKHPIIGVTKSIKKPQFSKGLAEFVGIILGDGGISKYQVVITLHSEDDREYSQFVLSLIKKLFGVDASISYRKKDLAINLTISRRELVKFCIEKLGLKQGDKVEQQVDVPGWIKENKQYAVACARGLVDTDGSVFTHRYQVNGKFYNYKKISFTSHSKPLLLSVFKVLDNLGISANIRKNMQDIRIDGQADVKKYFKLVSSNNPKYLKKY